MNKSLAALEDANPESLEGVVQHIDLNRQGGNFRIPDRKLRDLIVHFSKYRGPYTRLPQFVATRRCAVRRLGW